MKRVIKWFAGAVIALCVIVFGGGMLMPSKVEVSRDVVINAVPEKIFPHLNRLDAFAKWSPWSDLDPDMKVSYEGPEAGVGQIMKWASDKSDVGSGSQKIIESLDNEKVVTALDFGQMGTATARFDLAPDAGGTKVTWSLVSDLGSNPISRWFGPMIKSSVGEQYEKGLAKLRVVAEGE